MKPYFIGILLLFAAPILAIIVTDYLVVSMYGSINIRKLYEEFYSILDEVKDLRMKARYDKRAERRLRKRAIAYTSLRRRVMRINMSRLILLIPLYFVTVLSSFRMQFYPYPINIPLLTLSVKGLYVIPASMLLLLSYVAWLPLVQYPPIFALSLRGVRGQRSRKGGG